MEHTNNHQYKYIYLNHDVHKGLLCIKNTNIPLYVILEDISKGYTIDEILNSYPTLSKQLLTNALEEIAEQYGRINTATL